ncbi:MAG TPA: thiol reductant ABC exporter subunit CydD [Pseudogracilibacillus sp.]|nr:thiol reductant ABC exporter subunit CydD [Pseudogracilibacillus sp.]
MKKSKKGLPVFPGSLSNYTILTILILLESSSLIAQAYFLARAITALFERIPLKDVTPFILAFFSFYVLRQLFVQIETKLATQFANKTTENLRNKLFSNYFAKPISRRKGTGHLVTLAMEGIDDVRKYLEIIGIRTLRSFILPIAIVIFIFPFDWISAAILIITVPIVIVFMILLGIAAEKMANKQYETYKRLSNHFVDSLKGLETLTFLGKSKSHAKQISQVSNQYRTATMRTLRVAFLSTFALDFFSSLSIAFVAVGLGFRLIDGSVLLQPALTILILAPEYFRPIKDVGKDYHATLNGQLALEEIDELIGLNLGEDLAGERVFSLIEQPESLQIEGITVSIDGNPILKDLYTTVEKGMIGIIGASGSGKSTFIQALAGRLPFDTGTVHINNEGFNSLHHPHWFEKIAYIPQHPYIFPISLKDNICFYRPETTDGEVKAIVEKIGLTKIVEKFPKGINEKIGEGHRSLSGGQEQRIAMARALLSEKPIILLDEPTAHLDIATEYEIKQLMLELFKDKFVFIATHRLHWMKHMDQVLVFDKGRIVEQGRHEDLLENGEIYQQFVKWREGDSFG